MGFGEIAGVSGLIVAVISGIFALVTKKVRAPVDDREDKKVVIDGGVAYLTAGASIITQVQQLLASQQTQHELSMRNLGEAHTREINEVKDSVKRVQQQLDEMTRERPLLIQIIHSVARIARKHGGAAAEAELRLIQTPAKDVDLLK